MRVLVPSYYEAGIARMLLNAGTYRKIDRSTRINVPIRFLDVKFNKNTSP